MSSKMMEFIDAVRRLRFLVLPGRSAMVLGPCALMIAALWQPGAPIDPPLAALAPDFEATTPGAQSGQVATPASPPYSVERVMRAVRGERLIYQAREPQPADRARQPGAHPDAQDGTAVPRATGPAVPRSTSGQQHAGSAVGGSSRGTSLSTSQWQTALATIGLYSLDAYLDALDSRGSSSGAKVWDPVRKIRTAIRNAKVRRARQQVLEELASFERAKAAAAVQSR